MNFPGRIASTCVVLAALSGCAASPNGATPQPLNPASSPAATSSSAAPIGHSASASATSSGSGPVTPSVPTTRTAVAPISTVQSPATPSPSASPSYPAELQGLAPLLANRFLAAQAGARRAGLTLTLTSGWRSKEQQQEIFDAKVAEVGSVQEAEKWVLPPEKSEHVKGMAIDVGPTVTEMGWLEQHQLEYGLCRMYRNEPWHFELSNQDGTCSPMKDSALEA